MIQFVFLCDTVHAPNPTPQSSRRLSPEVDVEQHPLRQEHEVVQMPVTDAEQVGHHAAPRTAAGEVVQCLALHTQGAGRVRVVVPQELQHAVFFQTSAEVFLTTGTISNKLVGTWARVRRRLRE